ncbi:MAG: glutamine synthetase type III, partial [Ruminococcaceae bacterium]|nr:glutamine synthetase type III [Oscillospiraceae bacterium]
TLFGAKPPKGQELDDHYFGTIPTRVVAFMKELDRELWRLGVLAKTRHNEGAPAQYELAPIFTTTNIATDHNQLTMEIMKRIAARHGLVCLLHEKPFEGVNGSGKHNNWSISTSDGVNLLEPGDTPHENAQFLLFLCAVIKAVDEYQGMLRLSVATAGNDHRLGSHEAPPAVISMFLGDELTALLDSIEQDKAYDAREKVQMKIGVHVLPRFPKDTTDRNRTSPFAFTGNKFEFRMPGSSLSVAGPNIVLNTAVADVLSRFASRLEQAEDFETELHNLIKETVKEHKRIIFNGNGYDDAWVKEATEKRGLLNLPSTPEALLCYLDPKNIELFGRHGVFSETEIRSRYEILVSNYCKVMRIEGRTMLDMVNKDILPAISAYTRKLADGLGAKLAADLDLCVDYEKDILKRLCDLLGLISASGKALETELANVKQIDDRQTAAEYYRDKVIPVMKTLRSAVDEAETVTDRSAWPYPSYSQLLYGIE